MDCAQGSGEAPPELQLYWMCQRFPGALPSGGAIGDQSAQLMYRMSGLDNIYRAVTKYRNSYGKQIHQLTNSERMILRSLIDEGLL